LADKYNKLSSVQHIWSTKINTGQSCIPALLLGKTGQGNDLRDNPVCIRCMATFMNAINFPAVLAF
jgi:hypothetical protein